MDFERRTIGSNLRNLAFCAMTLVAVCQPVKSEEPAASDRTVIDVAAETDAQKTEHSESELGFNTVPNWFVPNAVFSAEVGMLYVRTDATCMNRAQAGDALELHSLAAVNKILDDWFGENAGEKIGLDSDYVVKNLLFQQHWEIHPDDDPDLSSFAKEQNMPNELKYYVGYAQLHLDDAFRQYAANRWLEFKTRNRLISGGLIGGALLGLLAVVFGYLKMEAATRGFYSRRLQTATLVMAFVILVAAFWLQGNLE